MLIKSGMQYQQQAWAAPKKLVARVISWPEEQDGWRILTQWIFPEETDSKIVLGNRILESALEQNKFAWVRESSWICVRLTQNGWDFACLYNNKFQS